MSVKDTRSRIIDTAVRLFNSSGTRAVSTNHIAQDMEISPGNLYYYFSNKEEIIRAILGRMIGEMDATWQLPADRPPSFVDLRVMLTRILLVMWNYRFFQRELVTLMQRDERLMHMYRTVRQHRWDEMNRFFGGLAERGVLRAPEDPTTMPALLKVGWLISEHWLSFLDLEGRAVDRASVEEGIHLMVEVMRPYLTEDALTELARFNETLPGEVP